MSEGMRDGIKKELKKAKKIFIVGTGTDVGKTYVTGLILKKLREKIGRASCRERV